MSNGKKYHLMTPSLFVCDRNKSGMLPDFHECSPLKKTSNMSDGVSIFFIFTESDTLNRKYLLPI